MNEIDIPALKLGLLVGLLTSAIALGVVSAS